jgi:hypothetical protein
MSQVVGRTRVVAQANMILAGSTTVSELLEPDFDLG